MIEQTILAQLLKYPDGLSIEHLQSLMNKDCDELRAEIKTLLADQEIIQGSNGWYYLAEPTEYHVKAVEPVQVPSEAPAEKPKSIRDKVVDWLEARKATDRPVTVNELATMFGTNQKTANNAVLIVSRRLSPAKAAKLKAAIIKRQQRSRWDKGIPVAVKRSMPTPAGDTQPIQVPVDTVDTSKSSYWIEEVRQCIKLNMATMPAKRLEWRDTLIEIERLFGEMGVAVDHRSRVDLREMGAWLTQN
jgi:hypothetical protein